MGKPKPKTQTLQMWTPGDDVREDVYYLNGAPVRRYSYTGGPMTLLEFLMQQEEEERRRRENMMMEQIHRLGLTGSQGSPLSSLNRMMKYQGARPSDSDMGSLRDALMGRINPRR